MNEPAIVGSIVGEQKLPSGGHAILRDPRQLRAKDKRRVINAIQHEDQKLAASMDLMEGCVAMLVERWELPYLPNAPLPGEVFSILGELEIPDYDTLIEAAGPAAKILFPAVTVDDAGRPGTPTPPANA